MRKSSIFLGAVALGLLACGPSSLYEAYQQGAPLHNVAYKAGVTPAAIARDQVNCRAEAAREVPQNIRVSTTPLRVSNGRITCREIDGEKFCRQGEPRVSGGETKTRDLNAGLRVDYFGQCMADRGYRFVSLPPCPAGIAVTSQLGDPLPALGATTCYKANAQNELVFFRY